MNITIDGKEYDLNVDTAFKAGVLRSKERPKPGNVYISSAGTINSLLLVQAVYNSPTAFSLLGFGTSPNSNLFYQKLHSLDEIEDFLERNSMKFSHNIRGEILDLMSSGNQ